MLPVVCFTCGRNLANLQIPYEEYRDKISNDPNIPEEEKRELIASFIKKYELGICCNMRILTFLSKVNIIQNE